MLFQAIKTIAKYDENFKFKLIMEIGFLVQVTCSRLFFAIFFCEMQYDFFSHVQKKKKNIFQSVCQKAFSIIGYASLSVISKYASNNDWVLFGTTTLAWPLIHAVDG